MKRQAHTRRASYGPTSPTIGERGTRTRHQILEAGRNCFLRDGFHATSMDDIALASETSRATLYQYFESKDAIFIELMHKSGSTLIGITHDVGPLGPDAQGFRNLSRWIRDWVANFDRFASMFVEWTNVIAPGSPLRPEVDRFVEGYCKKFGKELRRSGQADGTPEGSAILLLAQLIRFNYVRHVYRPGLTDEQCLDSLSTALQLYLFPQTPVDVLAGDRQEQGPLGSVIEPPPASRMGPLASLPPSHSVVHTDPLEGLGTQAAATARQLVDASCRVFTAHGYGAANIDQVVAEAGLARGTFYRYFASKAEVLMVLAPEVSRQMRPLLDGLPAAVEDPDALRAWLRQMLLIQRRYAGVLRILSEGVPTEPVLLGIASEVVESMGVAVRKIFGARRPYPLARRAAGMLLLGLIEHFPNEGIGTRFEPTDEQVVEIQARFIERVLLPA